MLNELVNINPEHLNEATKKLFDTIMQVIDERNLAIEMLIDLYGCPCELDDFNLKKENLEYCSKNCSVDEEVFRECWIRYFRQKGGKYE